MLSIGTEYYFRTHPKNPQHIAAQDPRSVWPLVEKVLCGNTLAPTEAPCSLCLAHAVFSHSLPARTVEKILEILAQSGIASSWLLPDPVPKEDWDWFRSPIIWDHSLHYALQNGQIPNASIQTVTHARCSAFLLNLQQPHLRHRAQEMWLHLPHEDRQRLRAFPRHPLLRHLSREALDYFDANRPRWDQELHWRLFLEQNRPITNPPLPNSLNGLTFADAVRQIPFSVLATALRDRRDLPLDVIEAIQAIFLCWMQNQFSLAQITENDLFPTHENWGSLFRKIRDFLQEHPQKGEILVCLLAHCRDSMPHITLWASLPEEQQESLLRAMTVEEKTRLVKYITTNKEIDLAQKTTLATAIVRSLSPPDQTALLSQIHGVNPDLATAIATHLAPNIPLLEAIGNPSFPTAALRQCPLDRRSCIPCLRQAWRFWGVRGVLWMLREIFSRFFR